MSEENLKKVNDSLEYQKVKQIDLVKTTKIAPSTINEILLGKRRFNNVKLAVWIEIYTKAKVTAEWILKTDFEDHIKEDLAFYKNEAAGKLNSIKEDLLFKIELLK